MRFVCKSLEDTDAAAKSVSVYLKNPRIVAFTGGLGAGKTTFISYLCRHLGFKGRVLSPTFSLMNRYDGEITIYHYDMYRIHGFDDLYALGFFDYIGGGLSLIEWSENIEGCLPEDTVHISINTEGDTRIIDVSENIKC